MAVRTTLLQVVKKLQDDYDAADAEGLGTAEQALFYEHYIDKFGEMAEAAR